MEEASSVLTLHEALFSRPDDTVFSSGLGGELTLSRFRSSLAQAVVAVSSLPGSKAALCIEDTELFCLGLAACLYAGKEPVILGNFTPSSLSNDSPLYSCVLTDFDVDLASGLNLRSLCEAASSCAGGSFNPPAPDPISPITFYTSGSTGTPKRIVKTLEVMEEECRAVAPRAPVPHGAWLASTVPPYHMYGMTFVIFMPLLRGIPFYGKRITTTEELSACMRPTILVSSPAFLKRFDPSLKPPTIVLALSAGAPLPEEAAAAFKGWCGCPVTEIYGSTETNVVGTRVIPGSEKRFKALPCARLTPCENGTLLDSPLVPGRFMLDDRIVLDGDLFSVQGRRDRIVKIEEVRISLDEIERLALKTEGVYEAAALTVPSGGRTVTALVLGVGDARPYLESRGRRHALERSLRSIMKDEIPSVGLPRRFRFLDALPVNAMGKRLKSSLAELFK